MQDNIYQFALPRMAEGIRKATAVVRETLGAAGKNVVLEHKLNPKHLLTNDGATLIQAIELADPVEAIGLSFLKEAVERSNSNSGDGSTTTCVLLNSILEEGIRSGVNTLEIKRSLDECLPIIEASIHDQTKQITLDDIPMVAKIAGESEEIARVLGKIYKSIGKDGVVHLENSGTFETSFDCIEGVRFVDTGYLSPYMAHEDKTKAIYKNPSILITKNKISHLNDINPLIAALQAKNKKDLVIFTDDMDSGVARMLIKAHTDGILNVLVIKAPTLWKQYVFEDFAKITGATIIEDTSGVRFKDMQLSHLGTCETLICDKEETTVIGIKDISDHIKELEADGSPDAKLRLSWLNTKTAILKLGAQSETELSWKRLKAEDALWSCRSALQGGIVAGGGIALYNCACLLENIDTIGARILANALQTPYKQILQNANISSDMLRSSPSQGFDAKTGKMVDMFEAGIVDSAPVVRNSVRNALGIASTLLTSSAVITLPPPTAQDALNNVMMNPMRL